MPSLIEMPLVQLEAHLREVIQCNAAMDRSLPAIDFKALSLQARQSGDSLRINLVRNFHVLALIHQWLSGCSEVPKSVSQLVSSIPQGAIYDAELPAVLKGCLLQAINDKALPWQLHAKLTALYGCVGFSTKVKPAKAYHEYLQFLSGEGAMRDDRFHLVKQRPLRKKMQGLWRS